jgi:hydrogenase maturation protease
VTTDAIVMPRANVLVLGVGNLLMGDEGVGVHAVRRLQQEALPPHVSVVDGGTGGFHLLSYLSDFETVVMIDATMDGRPAGTVSVIRPRHASDFPRTLSAHDIGLRDLVESAALLQALPTIHLVTISIDAVQPMRVSLSPVIEASLPRLVETVRELVAGSGSDR